MKKLILTLIAPIVLFSTLSAQITQQQADSIVQQRMSSETKPFIVYAKEDVQPIGYTITTTTGEILEFDYSAWVYYVSFTGETFGKYLIVKESSGNVLEVNVKNDTGPVDLEGWREFNVFPMEIPFEEFTIEYPPCYWIHNPPYVYMRLDIINYNEEFENFISCTDGNIPVINLSRHTLLLARGRIPSDPAELLNATYIRKDNNNYTLKLEIFRGCIATPSVWIFGFLVPKIASDTNITLDVTYFN
jgi:hypothetical protein